MENQEYKSLQKTVEQMWNFQQTLNVGRLLKG